MTNIYGVSYYVDSSRSVADPELRRQNMEALRPLRTYVAAVIALADGWMLSAPANPAYASLAIAELHSWAAGGALLGATNRQGDFERKWTLGSLALAYLKVRQAPGLDPARLSAIETWLKTVAQSIQPTYERLHLGSNNNNHAYWAGLSVAAAGIASQSRPLFDWGMSRARMGIHQIDSRGFLPLELEREARALHYHRFALSPLVLLGEMAEANGIALYNEKEGAIRRLADRVIAGFRDPTSFSERVEADQEITRPPTGVDLAWAEPYYARFRDRQLEEWIVAARPLVDHRLGGDLTATFGAAKVGGE
jgi:poly(beta-D-mannuronate) lyase